MSKDLGDVANERAPPHTVHLPFRFPDRKYILEANKREVEQDRGREKERKDDAARRGVSDERGTVGERERGEKG